MAYEAALTESFLREFKRFLEDAKERILRAIDQHGYSTSSTGSAITQTRTRKEDHGTTKQSYRNQLMVKLRTPESENHGTGSPYPINNDENGFKEWI